MKMNTQKIIVYVTFIAITFACLMIPITTFAKKTNDQKSVKNSIIQKKLPEIQCIQNAIIKRDDGILSAIEVRYKSQKSSIETRKTELLAAWDIANQKNRRLAIKNAWQKYSDAIQNSQKTFDATRNNSWKQYYQERKACGKNAISDDRTTEGVDNNI